MARQKQPSAFRVQLVVASVGGGLGALIGAVAAAIGGTVVGLIGSVEQPLGLVALGIALGSLPGVIMFRPRSSLATWPGSVLLLASVPVVCLLVAAYLIGGSVLAERDRQAALRSSPGVVATSTAVPGAASPIQSPSPVSAPTAVTPTSPPASGALPSNYLGQFSGQLKDGSRLLWEIHAPDASGAVVTEHNPDRTALYQLVGQDAQGYELKVADRDGYIWILLGSDGRTLTVKDIVHGDYQMIRR